MCLTDGASAPAAHAAPTAADPISTLGSDGKITFEGRGFGHGRGMSQWGAYGAADAGLSWRQILGFYYPGATQASQRDSEMRVWISRDKDGATQVPPQAGLTATVGRQVYRLPTGANYTAWRALQSGSTVALQHRDARGTWRAYRIPTTTAVVFSAGGLVSVTMPNGRTEQYAGSVVARSQGGKVITVVSTTTERYLRGVVPNEMPSSWHVEANAAQSVAARTYASSYRARQRAKGAVWDICDTVTCQVYRGQAEVVGGTRRVLDDARATAAIAATAGTVLKTPGGNFVHAEFSASNGGYTVNGGAFSQVAKPDPYDGRMKNPNSAWTRTVNASVLVSQFGLGQLRSLQVLDRDGRGAEGGRAKTVRLIGAKRTVDVSGTKMRQVLGLKSDWFTIRTQDGVTKPSPGGRPAAGTKPPALPGTTAMFAEWSGDRTLDRLTIRSGRLMMDRGRGGGTYGPRTPVAGAPAGLARIVGVGDVDYDRRADVVAIDTRNRLVVLKGNGKGAVTKALVHGGGWSAFRSLELRDVTKDRRADIIATRTDGRRLLYVGTARGVVVGKGAYTGR
ncbi:hypothetical protein GCM10025883_09910 [Mobilicoccus caccae]|uniref:Sporulation stage II protein D amidase enhancer LytB N-terminal domain-containing protein n=1 Tax=Mobilicoccus caccae TaxID=1859295 RepID=A0ABQ6IND8_9MICO|nr:hypothetical protein GCM10025883_09910 [Mobilicoccus caccae]